MQTEAAGLRRHVRALEKERLKGQRRDTLPQVGDERWSLMRAGGSWVVGMCGICVATNAIRTFSNWNLLISIQFLHIPTTQDIDICRGARGPQPAGQPSPSP